MNLLWEDFILPFRLKISVSGKKCLKRKTSSIQSESALTNKSANQWKGGGSPLILMEELMAILDSEAETAKAKQKAHGADPVREDVPGCRIALSGVKHPIVSTMRVDGFPLPEHLPQQKHSA